MGRRSMFPEQGHWYKGNLHTHTTRSDGLYPPEKQIGDYKNMGYHFLSITDHNRMDNYSQYCTENFLMLPAWERDILYSSWKCLHLIGLCEDGEKWFPLMEEPCLPESVTGQQLVNGMRENGQLVILAHPDWSRVELEEAAELQGYIAIEVFNNGCEKLCHAGHSEHYWDLLLRRGRRVWGIACDDTHGKAQSPDRFGGWIQAKAPSLTARSVLKAVVEGHFYSSSGPDIIDFGFEDNSSVYLQCSPCREIHFITYPARGYTILRGNKPLTEGRYTLKGGESYIRVECVDDGGHTAWTNPIYLR